MHRPDVPDVGAAGGSICIAPAVVLADEFGAIIDADGQPYTTMQATIFPGVYVAVVCPPERKFTPQ